MVWPAMIWASQREDLDPIWDRWNHMSPVEQREQWQNADTAHLELLGTITAEHEQTLRVPYFAGPMDLATYLGYRLSEHAIHLWDIAVAIDPAATVGHLDLIWERIDLIVARFHDSTTRGILTPQRIVFDHDDRPGVQDHLDISEEVHLVPGAAAGADATVTATTEVLTRLVYGRLRGDDRLHISGSLDRHNLMHLFPGF